jgi:hypothetical protein
MNKIFLFILSIMVMTSCINNTYQIKFYTDILEINNHKINLKYEIINNLSNVSKEVPGGKQITLKDYPVSFIYNNNINDILFITIDFSKENITNFTYKNIIFNKNQTFDDIRNIFDKMKLVYKKDSDYKNKEWLVLEDGYLDIRFQNNKILFLEFVPKEEKAKQYFQQFKRAE